MHIVYLHGFLSGSKSYKGTVLRDYLNHAVQQGRTFSFSAPDYPDNPLKAEPYLQDYFVRLCAEKYQQGEEIGLFGSSMGGFYASLLAERFELKAVLINPCVHPSYYLPYLTTEQENPYTHEKFVLSADMLGKMAGLERELETKLTPSRYLVLLQSGDEVLDHRQALSFYQGSQIDLKAGGCHAYDGFAKVVAGSLAFLTSTASSHQ